MEWSVANSEILNFSAGTPTKFLNWRCLHGFQLKGPVDSQRFSQLCGNRNLLFVFVDLDDDKRRSTRGTGVMRCGAQAFLVVFSWVHGIHYFCVSAAVGFGLDA